MSSSHFFRKWIEVMPLGMSNDKKAALEKAVSYLKATWFDDVSVKNWFQGSNPLGPITNNIVERTNGILKSREYSNRVKLGFRELYDLVRSYLEFAANFNDFAVNFNVFAANFYCFISVV